MSRIVWSVSAHLSDPVHIHLLRAVLCVGARLCRDIMTMRRIMNGCHAMRVVMGVVRDRVGGGR
jgi:hypothetical protein